MACRSRVTAKVCSKMAITSARSDRLVRITTASSARAARSRSAAASAFAPGREVEGGAGRRALAEEPGEGPEVEEHGARLRSVLPVDGGDREVSPAASTPGRRTGRPARSPSRRASGSLTSASPARTRREGRGGVAVDQAHPRGAAGEGGVDAHHGHASPSHRTKVWRSRSIRAASGSRSIRSRTSGGEPGLAAGAAPGRRGDVDVGVQGAVEPATTVLRKLVTMTVIPVSMATATASAPDRHRR